MRKIVITSLATLFVLASVSCKRTSENVELKNYRDSMSWALGENTAIGMQNIGYDFDVDMVLRAIEYTLGGGKQPLSEQAYNEMMSKIALTMQSTYKKEQQKAADEIDKEEAKLFEDLMKNDPDVKMSPDGFCYKVLKQGKGDNVQIGQVAVFDYKGYILKDNRLIDQTYGVRKPIETLVGGGMFKGLQMGMSLMNPGSIYRLYFPSKLAFGAKGNEVIPPNTAIYYDVELHSFHP